jgi:hypothetical protein
MKYRKLRITFSATCLIASVLLITLWVRSNHYIDTSCVPLLGSSQLSIRSYGGAVWLRIEQSNLSWLEQWRVQSKSFNDLSLLTGFEVLPPRATFRVQSGGPVVPYWFLVPTLAGLAATPWLRWRFSLRTLLIGMTVVAVLLGAVVWAVK